MRTLLLINAITNTMRIIFSLFLLCGLNAHFAFSQNLNHNIHGISQSEVPKPIIKQQEKLFTTNFISKWQVQEIDGMEDAPNMRYIANFEEDGRPGFSASYLPNGLLLFTNEFMPKEIIPDEVKLKTKQDYKDFTIQSADFITFYNPEREIYMVQLLLDNGMQYAFYDTAGNEIDKNNLPVEMLFLF